MSQVQMFVIRQKEVDFLPYQKDQVIKTIIVIAWQAAIRNITKKGLMDLFKDTAEEFKVPLVKMDES